MARDQKRKPLQVALIQAPTGYADGKALEQIAAGAKPITKAHGSLADIAMATIAQDAITGFQQAQAATLETTGENRQIVSAATAHRLLGDFLAAQAILQWLKDNDRLKSELPVATLAKQYAGQLKQQQQCLDQFDG